MKKEFLTDPAVSAAMNTLHRALKDAAKARKTSLKSLFIYAALDEGGDGLGLVGCVCPGCRARAAKTLMQQALTVPPSAADAQVH